MPKTVTLVEPYTDPTTGSMALATGSSTAGGDGGSTPRNCWSVRECSNVCWLRAGKERAAALATSSAAAVGPSLLGGPVSMALLFNLAVDLSFDAIELAHFKGPEPTNPKCNTVSNATAAHREHLP